MKKRLITLLLVFTLTGSLRVWAQSGTPEECDNEASRVELTEVSSTMYGQPVAVNVYLPPCYGTDPSKRYPVIYLLHGGGSDETQWPDLNVQQDADSLIRQGEAPFVVVMPGADYMAILDYGAFVIKDLLPGIEAQYQVETERAGRAIGGLSLGGYWALKTALLHPDRFAAVGGYSPVVDLGHSDDPIALAAHADVESLGGLSIGLDVGRQDSLAYDTNNLYEAFRGRDVPVTLTMSDGGHQRAYWRAHTAEYFIFLLSTIAPPRGAVG